MRFITLLISIIAFTGFGKAQTILQQPDTIGQKIYRASYPKTNELIHTKLDVRFDYSKAWMLGKAWITLAPHFYPTDSLRLDAKGMDIREISLIKNGSPMLLKYEYDSLQLFIHLDKTYKQNERYTIYIEYTSKPNEFAGKSAISAEAKGLHFINPVGEDPNKPTQIWTQGETESNSVWMPTIDKPNQKSTGEIAITVPDKYATLSNGLLINQKKNADSTRTDFWKMELPHAPYLFFMAVGEFTIVKDSYKGKEVSYYVEKKYEPFARKIFGNTPEMMKFFSEKLGVDYPWPKYAQVVVRDYESGAMENTSATLHQESAYQNDRQLTDGNSWEETIAHELFHQWFGDLVTPETWSNITISESFADYSEYLWLEYKKGKDAADEHNYNEMQEYLHLPNNDKLNLVRFNYEDREEIFDAITYNKGGRILNMLRNYVGDEAFFKSLNNYLTGYSFKTAEADQLRLAFEETTGEDLNWFWNQWFYGSGHPKLKIDYTYDDAAGKVKISIEQIQQTNRPFRLPVAVDIYNGPSKSRHLVWIENKIDSFTFLYKKRPDLVNVDGDKVILCEKSDNKTADNFIFQLKFAANYIDRREALEMFSRRGMSELALGLTDKSPGLRSFTIEKLSSSRFSTDTQIVARIENIANSDKSKLTRAAAIKFLGKTGNRKYLALYTKLINDSSYSIAGAALEAIAMLDPAQAYSLAKKMSNDAKGLSEDVVTRIILSQSSEDDFDFIASHFNDAPLDQEKLLAADQFATYLSTLRELNKVKKGIDCLVKFRNSVPLEYREFTEPLFKNCFDKISQAKGTDILDYINTVVK